MVELIAGYWHGWSIIRVCVGKMPFNRPFLSLLKEEARHPTLPLALPSARMCLCVCVGGNFGGGGSSRWRCGGSWNGKVILHSAPPHRCPSHTGRQPLSSSCYTGSQSGGLIVLYLWFIFIMIKLVRAWTEGVAAGWHHPTALACGD